MPEGNDWVEADEFAIREFNSLRGKICSIIESMDLPHRQERGVITKIKQETYGSQAIIAQLLEDAVPEKKYRYNPKKVDCE